MRDVIARDFGTRALPDKPNVYQTKSKNAQEAHEAVRPTSALRTPSQVARYLTDDERRLYELIWKRAVASQMVPATLNTVSVDLAAGSEHSFRATGTTVIDPGFLAVYEEGKDTEDRGRRRRRPQAAGDEARRRACRSTASTPTSISPSRRRASPKPRWSRRSRNTASAARRPTPRIIQTLLFRKYVEMESRSFRPTDVGRAVSNFLTQPLHPLRRLRLHRQARGRARRGQRAAKKSGCR